MEDRDPLLVEREKTHGCFKTNARAAQEIKYVFIKYGYRAFAPEHQEVLDLIATKLGRILAGDPNHRDHWEDISGYAKLAFEAVGRDE